MKSVQNLKKAALLVMALLPFTANAQSTFIKTESAFGKMTIFGDNGKESRTFYAQDGSSFHSENPGYTYDKIDDLKLVIKYDCFLAFTDNPQEGLKDEMILQIGPSSSKFYSPLLQQADSILRTTNGSVFDLWKNANPVFIKDIYFTDLQTGEVDFTCRFGSEDFEYKEIPPLINWTVNEDTKEIRGHLCRKATGEFRGRTYEVWFTEEIPASVGPWKLRGLPGAILEAHDSEGLCRFEATGIQERDGLIEKAQYPYFKISRKEYLSMLRQFFKTPSKFVSMHLSPTPGIRITPPAKEEPLRGVTFLEKD